MFYRTLVILAVAYSLVTALPAHGEKTDETVKLKLGDEGPHFSGLTDRSEKWDSKERVGKKILVVYFYPADMTPGCTAQACAYRDALAELKREDVRSDWRQRRQCGESRTLSRRVPTELHAAGRP